MLRMHKSNIKVFGIISCLCLLSVSYVGLSFYSIPEKVNAAGEYKEWRKLENITYMQEMTIDICNNSEVGDHKALIDKRGGGYDNNGIAESYVVQKLSDNHCWMVQNLDLTAEKLQAKTGSTKLTGANSNVTADFDMAESTIGTLNNGDESQFGANVEYNKVAQVYSPGESANRWQKGYGAYYNYYAATAGTSKDVAAGSYGKVTGSICPKGWLLPADGERVEDYYSFKTLLNRGSSHQTYYSNSVLGLNNATGYLIGSGFFAGAGYVLNGGLGSVGSDGYYGAAMYWSSTTYGGGESAMVLNNTEVGSVRCYEGISVRCIANPNIRSIDPARQATTDVNVQVGPTITIDAAKGMSGEVDYTKILEGNISATVSSNLEYILMLSADEPALVNTVDSTKTISPVLSMNTVLEKGVTGWGIWTGNGTTAETRIYEPITTVEKAYHYDTSPAEDSIGTVCTFGVGIAVSPSIPNGTYSTVVTVTAANA